MYRYLNIFGAAKLRSRHRGYDALGENPHGVRQRRKMCAKRDHSGSHVGAKWELTNPNGFRVLPSADPAVAGPPLCCTEHQK